MLRSTMRTRASGGLALLPVSLLLFLSCVAQAAELAGVKLPDSMEVGGECLQLNGTALGKRFIFKVYVVALYLPAPTTADVGVVDPDVAKGFVMEFLRSVRKEKLVQAFKDGLQKNAGQKGDTAQVEIERFLALVKDVKKGDRVTFTYEPREGLHRHAGGRDADLRKERTSPTPSSCSTSAQTGPGRN